MVQGYDEIISGWGCEDEDFYHRLQLIGLARRYYPLEFVNPIDQKDSERLVGSLEAKRTSLIKNRFYFEAKKLYVSIWVGERDAVS
ncbi:MAG: hypothetical protein K9L82_02115 [Chromatiaceae bacterium]|nr:hypothetical protein [Chromatiaceae bacterium]